jgi:hypothetical protein
MLPQKRFGVPGHNVYVFMHEKELSILSPAQSKFFDQILDIPLRSIKRMSILIDAYSQIAAEISLELTSGEGHDVFLDSQQIQLNSIYLTFLPGHVKDFKDEIISSCPGLEVAESDKNNALKSTSSDDRNSTAPTSSAVTEEIFGGSQVGRYRSKKPSSESQEVGLRSNSIPETQVEQENTEKVIDNQDGLQSLVDAVIPAAQDEGDDLYDATPKNAKELSIETPVQNASGSKPTVHARTRKGVKPKAKAPIVQRDLGSKPNQGAAKDTASAPQTRAGANQQQTDLDDKAQQDLTSQGTKGKGRQSEPVTTAQRCSAKQPKKSLANSQPNRKTRTTRSSQVTDDIEDSDVAEKNKLLSRGAQKATAVSTNAKASSLKAVAGRPTDVQKNKPSVKGTENTSQHRKDPGYQQFSDDFITTPDEMDASTPNPRKKAPSASTTNTQTKKSSNEVTTAVQKPKRYSLNPPPKSTLIVGDEYDIPVYDDDDNEAHPKTKGKKSANTANSASKAIASTKITSKSRTKGTKADAKNRQSAPAALDRPVATRSSQRAAAAKAKEQLKNVDKGNVEEVDVVEQAAPPKPKISLKGKPNTGRGTTEAKVKSKGEVSDKVAPIIKQDEQISLLRQEEAPRLGVLQEESINHIDANDLYNATPKLPSKRFRAKTLFKPMTTDNQDSTSNPNIPKQNKDSAVDFSSKLGNLIGSLSDDEAETEPRNSIVRKELEKSVEPIKRKAGTASNGGVPTAKAVEPTGRKSIGSKSEGKSPVVRVWEVSDDATSLIEERERSHMSPPPALPKVEVLNQKMVSTPLGKLKANDEKIFKKPDIQPRPEETLKQLDNGESSTRGSIPKEKGVPAELEHDMALGQINDDILIDTAHENPIESNGKTADTSETRGKRKTELDVTTTMKRQRIDANQNHAKESSPLSSLPSSPPVRTKQKQPKKLRLSTENTSATRRSPRLMDRAKEATEDLRQTAADKTLLAKDPDRKPHLVSFGGKGALNQGVSTTNKVRKDRPLPKNVSEEASKPIRGDIGDRKRKREKIDVVEQESPPTKRQSISPPQANVVDTYEDGDFPALQESPPVDTIKTKSTQTRQSTRPPTRPSSQTSRVDKNGSPIASSQEDHFGKLRERLAEGRNDKELQALESASVGSPAAVQQRRISEVFGPKVVLENKPKGLLSSPEATATRYVPHEKTGNGIYQEVATKQVVVPEKRLQDPFTERAQKPSGFTERLMSGSSTGKQVVVPTLTQEIAVKKEKAKPRDDGPILPLHPRGLSKTDRRSAPTRGIERVDIREMTHVGAQNQRLHDHSMPSDMTTGTSCESESSEPSRMPLSERTTANDIWNVAIRPPPHYANLHDAIHRIADVSIISNIDERTLVTIM